MKFTLRYSTTIFLAALSGAAAMTSGRAAPSAAATDPTGLLDKSGQDLPALAVPLQLAANGPRFRDGSYAGGTYDAYYGRVQVKANVQGGRLVSVDVLQFPSDRRTSRAINNQALPLLEREVVRAQSTRVDTVSGATLTSEAYLRSLTSALGKAGS